MASNPTLRYPGNLADASSDWVQFDFYEYKAPYSQGSVQTQTAGADAGGSYYKQYNTSLFKKSVYQSIALYMPEDVSSSYQGTWGGREFGPLAPAALAAAGPILSATNIDAIKTAGQGVTQQIGAMRTGAIPYIGASAVASAMNRLPGFGGSVSANDILATTRGQILNPNTEVLYQGPQLRTFSLNYKMFGRSEGETRMIRDICNTFKKAVLPGSAADAEKNLINVPKIVQVTFKHKTGKNPWVSQYKACALGGVDVNYTPDGSWATYKEGQPIAVQLTLQFQELKLLYEQDINEGY